MFAKMFLMILPVFSPALLVCCDQHERSNRACGRVTRPACSVWSVDRREGKGSYKYAAGGRYEGEWKNDCMVRCLAMRL